MSLMAKIVSSFRQSEPAVGVVHVSGHNESRRIAAGKKERKKGTAIAGRLRQQDKRFRQPHFFWAGLSPL